MQCNDNHVHSMISMLIFLDHLFHASPQESRHVVVQRNGAWYKLPLYHRNRILSAAEIEWLVVQLYNHVYMYIHVVEL